MLQKERITESRSYLIRCWKSFCFNHCDQIDINSIQLGFMPDHGTADSIFILHQQDLFLKKDIYFMLVGLEKVFDCMLHKVLWWTMGTLGFEEWIISTGGTIYESPGSKVLGNLVKNLASKLTFIRGMHWDHYYIIIVGYDIIILLYNSHGGSFQNL